jgi:hypothetical protein
VSPLVLVMLLVTTFVLPFTPVQATDSDPEYWAVFVGISDYAELEHLPRCNSDAIDLYYTFKSFCPENHMKLLTNSGATKQDIVTDLVWLANNADSNDIAVFSFSGHSNGEYIAPYDSDNYSYANYIGSDQLNTYLNNINANEVVTILDCCDAESLVSEGSQSNRVNLLACSSHQISWDVPDFGNSVYSFYVIQAIDSFVSTSNDTVDLNHDYSLSFKDISEYASYQTEKYERDKYLDPIQNPTIIGNGDSPFLDKIIVNTNVICNYTSNLNATIDSANYSLINEVVFPCYPNSVHTIDVPNAIETSDGGTYKFSGWSGNNDLTSLSVSRGSYVAVYQEERSLTLTYVLITIAVVAAIVVIATTVLIRRKKRFINERVSTINEHPPEYTQAPFNMEKDPKSGMYFCKVCHKYSVWYNSYKGQYECLNPYCPNFGGPLH